MKNKLVTWAIILLVIANIVTLGFFWAGRIQHMKEGSPKEFLAEKLKLDENQKKQYFDLAKEHHENAQKIREKIKISKDAFFDLLQKENISDSTKTAAAREVSLHLEELDLCTLEHFKKVRALCNREQKEIFNTVIHQIIGAVNEPSRPNLRPNPPR
jgi:protein CpxP